MDIFRNGIRVYFKDEEKVLMLTGNPKTLEDIVSIRIDIRSINFCF